MSMPVSFVQARAQATRSVMDQISADWEWPDKSSAELTLEIDALTEQEEALTDREADTRGGSAGYQFNLDWLHLNTVKGLKLARVKYRNDPIKLACFRTLSAAGGGRGATYAESLNFESGWESADAAWVPVDGLTLMAFKTTRQESLTNQTALSVAETAEGKARATLNVSADLLHSELMAWYESATAVFATGTPNGDLIRAEVPTTYVVTAVPAQAVITTALPNGPGKVHLHYAADGAGSYDIQTKGPGQIIFTTVVNDTDQTEHEFTGLAVGAWNFIVIGSNVSGEGLASLPVVVTVA